LQRHGLSPQLVDIELNGIFFAIGPRGSGTLDVNAMCRASRLAHKTGDAGDTALFVAIEPMHAAINLFAEHATLLGILHGEALTGQAPPVATPVFVGVLLIEVEK
jgi:hypothetical protein